MKATIESFTQEILNYSWIAESTLFFQHGERNNSTRSFKTCLRGAWQVMLNLSKSIARSELFCSRHWDGKDYLVQFYTFLAVLCVVLSVTATLENFKIFSICVTMIFSGAFLAKLTSIAVDRLLALLLGITYGQVVIVNRTRTVVLFIWMKRNCGRPTLPLEHDIIPPFKQLITLELIISTYSYSGIFRTIPRQQIQLRDELEGKRAGTSPNMTR